MRQPLRHSLKAERQQVEPATRMAAAEAVAIEILARLPSSGGYLAGYWATDGELPLHIVQLRLPTNWIWCLPVTMPGKQLRFAPWRGGDPLASNQYGIPEPMLSPDACLTPEAMHVVIVPVVGFTRTGMRLGMGGGYYDASFAFRQNHFVTPTLIGIGYACQELDTLDVQNWDVNMDTIVTEREWIACQAKEPV